MIKKIMTSALIAATLSTSAFAFEQQGVKDGNNVLGLDLRYTSTSTDGSDETSEMTMLNATFSHFLTDSVELGVGLGYIYVAQGETTTYTLTPFAQYNFVDVSPTMVPYIGVGVALFNTESDTYTDDDTGYSAEAGVKMFVSENAAFVPAIYYESYEFFSTTGIKVGLQVYF